MYQEPKLYISYKLLEAKTPRELEKKMLELQLRSRKPINFTPPQFVQGKWTAWYLHDYSKDVRSKDKIKLESGR